MVIGSLFSGAGGLDLAVEAVFRGRTVWHCEVDSAASKVLAARWPSVPNLGDITVVDWSQVEPVDVLCGGFPCQDVSSAGRRAGLKTDTRSGLWAVFADAIAALRPPIVVIENVRGLLSARAHRAMESADATVGDRPGRPVLRAAGAVLGDLADLGYDARWATVSAASVGAPHQRERVFIVATPADTSDGAADGRRTRAQSRAGSADVAVAEGYGRHEGRPESAGVVGGSDAAVGGAGPVDLLPTPQARDWRGGQSNQADVNDAVLSLLPTLASADGERGPDFARAGCDGSGGDDLVTLAVKAERASQWGKYGAAIRRWEQLTRPAPNPTEPNTRGNPRLAAAFSEWLMGWPEGWVTAVAGISRNDALRIIGNGVCPQQAVAAIDQLLEYVEQPAGKESAEK